MPVLNAQGISCGHGLINEVWNRLLHCQIHSSATLTNRIDDHIRQETQNAYSLITSQTVFPMKLFSPSVQKRGDGYPLLVYNTPSYTGTQILHTTVQIGEPDFRIPLGRKELPYARARTVKKSCSVLHRDIRDTDPKGYFYEVETILQIGYVKGLSYRTLYIRDVDQPSASCEPAQIPYIENNRFRIRKNEEGIHILDYKSHRGRCSAIYLEGSGDERGSFDCSPPGYDWILIDYFEHTEVSYIQNMTHSCMTLAGTLKIPQGLKNREDGIRNSDIRYKIKLKLIGRDNIHIPGMIDNHAANHRVCLVFTGQASYTYSFTGTQYSYIRRESAPAALKTWKADG